MWARCNAAIGSRRASTNKLEAYIGQFLALVDEHPEAIAFLSDSARVLWPKASSTVRRHTMIGLARSLMTKAPQIRGRKPAVHADVAAASLQGTLAELARMLQVGVVSGPAVRWKGELVAFFRKVAPMIFFRP